MRVCVRLCVPVCLCFNIVGDQTGLLASWKVCHGRIWGDLQTWHALPQIYTHTQYVLQVWAVEGVWGVSWTQWMISKVGLLAGCVDSRWEEVKTAIDERWDEMQKCWRKLLNRKVSDQTKTEREKHTIFFGSEQYRVAQWAVTYPCVRQHLQHVHSVFLENPEEQRHTPLSFYHLNTGGTFWVLLTVQHLDTDTHKQTYMSHM